MWYYEIRGSENRKVKTSGSEYNTEDEAQAAGTDFLKNNKAKVIRAEYPDEVFSVMCGRK